MYSTQKYDIENLLWKIVFYRPISEFRQRLNASDKDLQNERSQKTVKAFLLFLEDSIKFYESLIDDFMSLATTNRAWRPELRTSLSRSFIRLGDLCRYRDSCAGSTESTRFQATRTSYTRAVAFFPDAGNAFNQLAVVESTNAQYPAAIYFYLRALHAKTSFAPARENLVPLLNNTMVKGPVHPYQSRDKPMSRPMSMLEIDVLSAYLVDVVGPLYLRIDMDTTPERLEAANRVHLADYLNRLKQQARTGGIGAAARRLETAQNANPTSIESSINSTPPTLVAIIVAFLMMADARALQSIDQSSDSTSSVLVARGYALTALFDVVKRLVAAAEEMLQNALRANFQNRKTILLSCLTSPCFSAISIALEWLVEKDGLPLFPGWIADTLSTEKMNNKTYNRSPEPLISGLQNLRANIWMCLTTLVKLVKSSLDVCSGDQGGSDNCKALLFDDAILLPEQVYTLGILTARAGTENYDTWEMDWTREGEISIPCSQFWSGPVISLARIRQIHASLVTLANRAHRWLEVSSSEELTTVVLGFVQAVGQGHAEESPGDENAMEVIVEEIVYEPVSLKKKENRRSNIQGDDLVSKRRSIENVIDGVDANERLAMDVAEQVLDTDSRGAAGLLNKHSGKGLAITNSQLPAHGLRSFLFNGKSNQ